MHGFDGFGWLAIGEAFWLIVSWVIIILSLFIVPRNRKPTAGMAWLLLIFFFPIVGIFIFLILGSPKLPKARRNIQKTLDSVIGKSFARLGEKYGKSAYKGLSDSHKSLATLSNSLSRLPVLSGNKLEVLPDYNETIQRIIADVNKAKHFVHLEYFIIAMDDVTESLFVAMAAAIERGVQVRVLYDSLSTHRYPDWKKMLQRLDADGVIAQPMLPFKMPGKGYVRPDLRNHRKLVVIDGHTGYTGSQNMIRRDYHRKDDIYYDELVVRAQGPIVLELLAVFMTDWFSETGKLLNVKELGLVESEIKNFGSTTAQILPSGPGYDDENNLKLFTSLIHTAEKSVIIVNPYFVPDDALMTAMTSAARRGVAVTMINSEAMDQWMVGHAQRSFYEELLKAGVKIYLYKSPILLHSKFITVDSDIATIGSSNLDIRSFFLDLEVTLVIYDPSVVKRLNAVQEKYLARSKQISLKQWQKRPQSQVLLDNIARLTSALQ